MKKQLNRKLQLNKETLRKLNEQELQGVVGGGTTGCSGTSSGSGCTSTLISDCRCPTTATTNC